MKRSGFTMIELIFVIVILGILAAVALPKFIGVSEEAQVSKLKGYVGTLNRTVAPALWSKSISNGHNGSIVTTSPATYLTDLNASLPPLENLTTEGYDFQITNLAGTSGTARCDGNGSVLAATSVGQAFSVSDMNGELNTTINIGDSSYVVGCVDGNGTNAPQFFLADKNGSTSSWVLLVK